LEIKDGVVDITWLGPESWLGVRLGIWILIVFAPILRRRIEVDYLTAIGD